MGGGGGVGGGGVVCDDEKCWPSMTAGMLYDLQEADEWHCHSHMNNDIDNRRNFRTRFNFVLSAESTKFNSIWKPCTYNSLCATFLAVQKFIAYDSSQTLEYEIFTRTKISAITVDNKLWAEWKSRVHATSWYHSTVSSTYFYLLVQWLLALITVFPHEHRSTICWTYPRLLNSIRKMCVCVCTRARASDFPAS